MYDTIKTIWKLSFSFLLCISSAVYGQNEEWDVYMAQYEKGAGTTLINMGIKNDAPKKNLSFILVTGVTFGDCGADGFPTKPEFDNLYKISDSIKSVISASTESEFVGTFTYQCERLDYYYINDTSQIRNFLLTTYSKYFKSYKPYINIKEDKEWKAYFEFLYPNEETYEFMSNQKVLLNLQEAGDKLDKPRQVDHWIFFKSETDRTCFLEYAMKSNFKLETKEALKQGDNKYRLKISRVDKIAIDNISQITLELRKQALKCNGAYDGWETFVIK